MPSAAHLFSSGVADSGYRIAPNFLVRLTGVPFDVLEALATPEITQSARAVVLAEDACENSRNEVALLLDSRKHDLSREQFRSWRKAVRRGEMPATTDPAREPFLTFAQDALRLENERKRLDDALAQEVDRARRLLLQSSCDYLPAYLVFAAGGLRDFLQRRPDGPLPPRNKSARARERHLLLYLQRICGKNDTLSEFGPHAWGRVERNTREIKLKPNPGIARREVFFERWAAHGIAAAINSDTETAMEIAPRLHPSGRLEGTHFIFTDSGETIVLEPETVALLAASDGRTPAYSLGADFATLRDLARRNLILWRIEVPALEPHAFEVIYDDVTRWRDRPARARWLEKLEPLAALPNRFAAASDPLERLSIIEEASARLEELGAHKDATRFLYSASNPIGEECLRDGQISIGEGVIDEVVEEAAPWIDLWRDNYAFIASRVAAGLRALFAEAPVTHGAVALPAFLHFCAEKKMPLTGPGMIAFAHLAFREVKEAFAKILQDRSHLAECQLTEHDCHFIRREFTYEKFDEFTYPSADLQLGSTSVGSANGGDYQWVLAELHPAPALLHHGLFWACPDKLTLANALQSTLFGRPNLHFGYFATDFTATTSVRFDALPELTKFVAPQRATGPWKTYSPADTEVFIQEENGDVALRVRGTREQLGSFARAWVIPLGFHPFNFSLGKHSPRLLCGKVVVQRQSWTVALEELGSGDFTRVSSALVVAIERLRAKRDLPRQVYIRPTEQALRRSGVEGRDKDTKPVFIDFESYLFLEIFHRWLSKAGELELTEMLPRPDQLLWQEGDGRRSFELRTQIIPK